MPTGVYIRTENHLKNLKLHAISIGYKKGVPKFDKGMKCPWKAYNKGKKLSKFTRLKMSITRSGVKNSAWKGGVTLQPNYINNSLRDWRKRNPIKVKAQLHRRRLLTRDLLSKTVQLVYEDNIKKYGTLTCYLCLEPIDFGKDCLEHKIPLSRGGNNDYQNLGVAHQICNAKKRNKTEEEYRSKFHDSKNAMVKE